MQDRMLKAALRYAALGWHVFPLSTTGDIKRPHPCLGKEGGHLHGTTDEEKIRGWWSRYPTAGIGVHCAASGLIVVDIDPRHGGPVTLDKLTAEYGPLDSPVMAFTGGGGEHRLFAAPAGLRSAPGRLGPAKGGIDLKFNGYIVLPPSLHPDGPRYRWAEGAAPFGNIDLLTYLPTWALDRAGQAPDVNHLDDDDPFREDTPVVGLPEAKIREILMAVPNTGDDEWAYDDWLNVIAGVYHETGGTIEGRDLAYEWSSQAMKHTDERFEKSWRSLDIQGKGRAPTTFRWVMKLANDSKAAKAAEAESTLRAKIAAAADSAGLKAVATDIKRTDLDPLTREALAGQIRARFKALTNTIMPIGMARNLIRYENPDVADLPDWLQGWVYCARDDKFFKAGTNELITTRAFDALFSVHLLTAKDIAEGRAEPEVLPSRAALNRYQLPKVHGRMYLPGEGSYFDFEGSRYLNSYSAASQPPLPAVWTPSGRAAAKVVEDHFSHLVSDPRERALVLSWLCSIVQTRTRPNWAVVLQGPEGDGKSFVTTLMGAVLGSENVGTLFASVIQESAFTSWAEGTLLTVIEEVKQHSMNRHTILDRLQPLITNDVIQVHVKGVSPYSAKNTAAYLLLTNHRDAVPVGAGDTRYFMVASPRQTKAAMDAFLSENPGYFSRLYGVINEEPGAVRRWMLEYPLAPGFNPRARAPRSIEHAHAVDLARPEVFDLINDALDDSRDPALSRLLLDPVLLCEALGDNHGHVTDARAIGRALASLGFTSLGRVRGADGERRRFWTLQPRSFERDREAAIREILDL